MNEVQHVTISLAGSAIDVFTDGDQRWISLTSMSTSVNKPDNSALRFFNGKSPEVAQAKASGALQFCNFRHGKFKTLVKCCPLGGAKFYWKYLQRKGDIQADALMLALAEESIERRVDGALGIHHTEAQYEEQTMALREKLIVQALQANIDIETLHLPAFPEEDENAWELLQKALLARREAYKQMTLEEWDVYLSIENAREERRDIRNDLVRLAEEPEQLEGELKQLELKHLNDTKQHKKLLDRVIGLR